MKSVVKSLLLGIIDKIPIFSDIMRTSGTASPITWPSILIQKVLGINKEAYWPVHFTSKIICPRQILIGIGTAPGLSPGCYIQGIGKVYIGDYTTIGPNVGIISANHDIHDHRQHVFAEVSIGRYCWIGMNAVVLPGVVLGDHTIVAAGAVVTKPFPDGYAVIAGNPAKIIKRLDSRLCPNFVYPFEYHGFIKREDFPAFRKRYLKV